MSVEWVDNLASLRDVWATLPQGQDPFMGYEWISAWYEAFGNGSTPQVAVLERDGCVAGLLPLMVQSNGRLSAMANDHTPGFRPLVVDRAALEELLKTALAKSGGTLTLPMLAEDHALLTERFQHWRSVISTDALISPLIDTSGSFEAWRTLTKARWETPIERLRRKMEREHDMEMRLVQDPPQRDRILTAGFAVEASGWKGREGTAIISRPETEAFYRAIAALYQARGELRVSYIALDGTVVAFDFCLLQEGRLYQLKTGFDDSLRRLAPGLVLRLAAIEHCFELNLDAYEFLGDRSAWKAKFATSERVHRTWTGFANNPRGSANYLYRRARRSGGRLIGGRR